MHRETPAGLTALAPAAHPVTASSRVSLHQHPGPTQKVLFGHQESANMLRTQYSWQLPTAVCMNTAALHGLVLSPASNGTQRGTLCLRHLSLLTNTSHNFQLKTTFLTDSTHSHQPAPLNLATEIT